MTKMQLDYDWKFRHDGPPIFGNHLPPESQFAENYKQMVTGIKTIFFMVVNHKKNNWVNFIEILHSTILLASKYRP